MRWVFVLLAAAVVLVVVGWVISALKWLLILAALLVFLSVIVGWRPMQRASKS